MTKSDKAVRDTVIDRDDGLCIICGFIAVDLAHIISKSGGGIGRGKYIEENLVCMCRSCHSKQHSNQYKAEYENKIAEYMTEQYEGWNKMNLIYRKGQ